MLNLHLQAHTVQQVRNRSFFLYHAWALMKKMREVYNESLTLAELLFIARNIRTVRNKISKAGSIQYTRPLAKSLLNRVRNNKIADFFLLPFLWISHSVRGFPDFTKEEIYIGSVKLCYILYYTLL